MESESWGPLGVNIANVADLEYSYTPGGIHADDFLNYEYSISYVNNMKVRPGRQAGRRGAQHGWGRGQGSDTLGCVCACCFSP